MNKKESEIQLQSILTLLDLKSDNISPFQSKFRFDPFENYSESQLSIKDVIKDILNRRFELLKIFKTIVKDFNQIPVQMGPRRHDIFEMSENEEPYNLPLKLPLKSRKATQNGVPPGDRVDDELFFTLIRILELYITDEGNSWEDFDKFVNQPQFITAIKGLEDELLVGMIMESNPNILTSVRPNMNLSALPDEAYGRFKESKTAQEWKSVLLRIMLVIYLANEELLILSKDTLRENFIKYGLESKSDKTIDPVITEYRKLLKINC